MKILTHIPLLFPVSCLTVGMVGCTLVPSFFCGLSFLAIAGAFLLLSRWRYHQNRMRSFAFREIGMGFLAVSMGFFWFKTMEIDRGEQTRELPHSHQRLAACISKPIKTTQYGSNAWLEVWAIKQEGNAWVPQKSSLLAYFPQQLPLDSFLLHDTLFLEGNISAIRTKHQGYRDYLEQNGIRQQIQVKTIRPGRGASHWRARIYQTQQYLGEAMAHQMTDSTLAAIAWAMFLGDKSHLTAEVKGQFSAAGLSHVLAISGMHVGIVALILGLFRHVFRSASMARKISDVLVLALLAVYVLLTGAGPAVVRAGIMFGAFLLARMWCLRVHPVNVLAFSALLQLLADPMVLFSAGFQLSYVAVGVLVTVYPRYAAWVKTPWRLVNWLYDLIGVSILATLATAPIVYLYFGTLPTYFLISNLLTGPIMFVLVASGFISVLLCGLIPSAAGWAVWVAENCLAFLFEITSWVAELPHASLHPEEGISPALGLVLMELALAGFLVLIPRMLPFFAFRKRKLSLT